IEGSTQIQGPSLETQKGSTDTLNAETIQKSNSPIFGFLRRGKMTSEDFRKLEFGIAGFESVKLLFQRYPTVIKVYPGCPAENEGIRPGDVVLKANDHEFRRLDMQTEFWRIIDGRAGTPVDITVRRHGKEITFHVIRMNIEDVPSDRLRRRFEELLR